MTEKKPWVYIVAFFVFVFAVSLLQRSMYIRDGVVIAKEHIPASSYKTPGMTLMPAGEGILIPLETEDSTTTYVPEQYILFLRPFGEDTTRRGMIVNRALYEKVKTGDALQLTDDGWQISQPQQSSRTP